MKWIDSTDIKQWSDKKDCQLNLGYLLYQMITESYEDAISLRFTYGDSTQYSGWDGILTSKQEIDKVQTGTSVWEWGCGEEFKEKADQDYEKRTKNPLGYKLEESSFVFVTTRVWEDNKGKNTKAKWIEERKKDGWKEIIIYDAVDLENWLNRCPVSGLWLAQQIRKYPGSSIQSLSQFWEDWKNVSNEITFSSSLVLAGREQQDNLIKQWLANKQPSLFALRAFTREEGLAFLCSVIETMDKAERDYYFSRALIVTDANTFDAIYRIHSKHILINYFDETDSAINAVRKGNHVFIPVGPDSTATSVNAELQVLGKEQLDVALKEYGLTEDRVQYFSKESGRSLSVLRRILQEVKHQPEWAKGEMAKALVPAVLLGRWDDTKTYDEHRKPKSKFNDRQIVELISKKPYDQYLADLSTYLNEQDPPLFQFRDKWRLISPIDAWFSLAPFITSEQLQLLKEIAVQVLGADDPEYDLDEDQRYQAEILGAVQPYSDWLTKGILQTIVLIALFGKRIPTIGTEEKAQQWADNIVFELMNQADEKRWFSVSSMLPELAEASPEAFLECIESELEAEDSSLWILFREGKDALFSRSNLCGLMWALETLAWSPQYLTRVTLILGKLASLDPGGKWGNRPNATFRGIFLAWKPYTMASLEQRLEALDQLCITDEGIAFDLLMTLFPKHHDIGHPSYKPRWRWFSTLKEPVMTWPKIYETYSAILDRLLTLAGENGNLLAKLIPSFDDFSFNQADMDKIYNHIESKIEVISLGKKQVKDGLRKLISRHVTYADADWALPPVEVERLRTLYGKFDTGESEKDYQWLFDEYYPELMNINRRNRKELEEAVEDERLKGVTELLNEKGFRGIVKLSEKVKQPLLLGEALALCGLLNEGDEFTLINLSDRNEQFLQFVRGYIFKKSRLAGQAWNERIINSLRDSAANSQVIVNFLISQDHSERLWNTVEEFGEDIQKLYWQMCIGLYGDDYPVEMKNRYYKNMLSAKRYLTAMDTASMYPTGVDTEFIIQILENAAQGNVNEPYKTNIDTYHCVELFKLIDERNDFTDYNRLYKLEWNYLSLLGNQFSERPPKMIHKDISENPESFVQFLKYIFKPKDDEEMEKLETKDLTKEQIEILYKKAYDTLYSLKTIPGTDTNGKINYEILLAWINKVITLCKDAKRVYAGYYYIGELLAKGIERELAPPDEICRVIEEIENPDLEHGFSIATFNRRGGFSKGVWEGGVQERGIADTYRKIAGELAGKKFRRSAQIYEKLAKSYDYDAQREDERAHEMKSEY